MDIFAALAIIDWHSRSVAKSGYCALRRGWGEVQNCRRFSCLRGRTVVYAVNSLIDVNLSCHIFHNSASESVIAFGRETFWRVSMDEGMTAQERKAQNLSLLSGVIDPVRVLSIRFQSGPVRSDPGFANGLLAMLFRTQLSILQLLLCTCCPNQSERTVLASFECLLNVAISTNIFCDYLYSGVLHTNGHCLSSLL